MSFKTKLEQYIKERHQVTYDELVDFTEKEDHKVETMVRECRKSQLIKPIKNEKHHITGYMYYDFYGYTPNTAADFLKQWPSKPKVEPVRSLF